MSNSNKPNVGFWIIAVVALIWNIMGVMSYLGTVYPTEESRAAYTAEQLALMDTAPSWLTGVFAVAVFSGALGCLLLILRRKWAVPIFGISLLAVLVQVGYNWFATDSIEVFGTVMGVVMPLFILIVAIFLYFYSKGAVGRGWLK
ncbi:MAG: hypothetical protein HKN48_04455 [Flavobacteriaceae bacterium]|nr:hypothetical protein [Flavobacteriaceae bacterium]